ncbi:MAG: tryptophan synthase subunit alpha [Deltaproteobacteria bacterium]|nr:tryptophan synthase subunit alpha [Deltaproteobacteria bacterium]
MQRYKELFLKLEKKNKGAFIPFVVIGDPDLETSLKIIEALIDAGADALELGIPFSDPVADGPVIQSAVVRALKSGTTPDKCFDLIKKIRDKNSEIPIGILTYTNAVLIKGYTNYFKLAADCGIDSVLAADMPVEESKEYCLAAKNAGVDTVFIAPPNITKELAQKIAERTNGYTYVVTRKGVTGADSQVMTGFTDTLKILEEVNAPYPVMGFGISLPEHVSSVINAGARGAISGSATVKIIEKNLNSDNKVEDVMRLLEELTQFVNEMSNAAFLRR